MKIGLKIIAIVFCVIVALGVIFVAYCGFSALFSGSGFVETMNDTWCTIFNLTQNVTETTPEIVETIVQ